MQTTNERKYKGGEPLFSVHGRRDCQLQQTFVLKLRRSSHFVFSDDTHTSSSAPDVNNSLKNNAMGARGATVLAQALRENFVVRELM